MKAALHVERKSAALKDSDGKAALMAKAFIFFFEVEKEVHSPKEKKGKGESSRENNTLLCIGRGSNGYCQLSQY